ncbi:MAG TPA: acyl-CoA dehydrogenase family protein [Polyangia bacterium]|jgi:alkylation response protein AidB-like acyl-CoA dehydrogenase|nr:acyl-CoA dehydrogenase family protein [Polyangia bacterium]
MTTTSRFFEIVQKLGPRFGERAVAADIEGRFVADNYADLKEARLMSALVPSELGGGGATHGEICQVLREIAHYDGSTSLALSMHTHLVAATVWRFKHGQPAEGLLRKVAASELVLVSTGAGDWVESVGKAERAEGGYRVSAVKRFGSGSPAGDMMLTSAPYQDPERGWEVLVFPVPLSAPGVTVRNDWDTMGMRATGSNSIELRDVFVADEAISVRRPRGQWHPSWSVTITVAAPIYMAPYIGIAERAALLAREAVKGRAADKAPIQALGEMGNALTVAQMAFREMIEIANNFDFMPKTEDADRVLIRKTIAANATVQTVNKAVEVVGGTALFRNVGIERLWRDVQAAAFHPLPEKKQLEFSGRVALGLAPIG